MGEISAFYIMPHPPIIIPKVGGGEEKKIQDTYNSCMDIAREARRIKPDTIIIVTPHGPVFRDAVAISNSNNISGNLGQFRAPKVSLNLEINRELTCMIEDKAYINNIPIVGINKKSANNYGIDYELDHGSIVPLYFINKEYTDYNIIHITYGILPKIQLYKLGMIIKQVIQASDTKVVFIGSGDLSHKLLDKSPYEYDPAGKWFDEELINLLTKGDVKGIFNMDTQKIKAAGECGLRSFYIMLGAMNGYNIKGNLLSYEAPFGVGYGVMSFNLNKTNTNTYDELIKDRDRMIREKHKKEGPYTKLARQSLTYYLKTGEYINIPDKLPIEIVKGNQGVFVTLYKDGDLRGCIGTILPNTNSTAEEIIKNAVSAGVHDNRFEPVKKEELDEIDFSVDILSKPMPATKDELDPNIYGVIVRKGVRTGVLLPDIEGVNTIEDQLSIALEKAGIMPDESYTIEKFKVTRHR